RARVVVVGPLLVRESLTALLAAAEPPVGVLSPEALESAADDAGAVVIVEVAGQDLEQSPTPALRRRSVGQVVLRRRCCSRQQLGSALQSGAAAFVSEEGGLTQLLGAIDAVRAGRRYVDPQVADLLVRGDGALASAASNGDGQLTVRERQVLALIAQGLTERE